MVLTDKETRFLALAFAAIDETPKVNHVYLATLTGMTLGSAKKTLSNTRKHVNELKEKHETIIDYNLGPSKGAKKDLPTSMADPKPEKDQSAKLTKNEVRGSDSNNGSTIEPSAVTAKPKARGKTATRKSPTIKIEPHDPEPEAGEQADEEDNACSGAVTDVTPLTTQTSNVHLEQEAGDQYADMYGDGNDGKEILPTDVNNAKGTGKKRSRGGSQKKAMSLAPTPPSESNDDEPPTPSKKVRPTPNPVLQTASSSKNGASAIPGTKAVKNRGNNISAGSAGSQAYDEFLQGSSQKPVLSTDGANDIGDSIVVARNKTTVASPFRSDESTHTESNGQKNKKGTSPHVDTPVRQSTSTKLSKETIAQPDINASANPADAAESLDVWSAVNKAPTISKPTLPAPSTDSAPPPASQEDSTITTQPAKTSKKSTKKAAYTNITPSRPISSNNAIGKTPNTPAAPATPTFKSVEVVLPIARPRTPTPASGSNSKLGRRGRGDGVDAKPNGEEKENRNGGHEVKRASAAKAKNMNKPTTKTKIVGSDLVMVNGRWTTAGNTHEQSGNAGGLADTSLFIPDSDSVGDEDAAEEDSMGDTICVEGKGKRMCA